MTKIKRHTKIIELIKSRSIETQEELAEELRRNGFEVTQATISRDIRELKLTKIGGEGGRQRYAVLSSVDKQINERLVRVFQDGVLSMDYAGNLLVIHTLEGLAMAVAASLDAMGFSEIIGSIAGDDTLMCVTKSEALAVELLHKLDTILKTKT